MCPDLLIYAGVTGTKFIANCYPQKDREIVDSAIQNIKRINAKKTVLISTVDIYDELDHSEKYFPESSQFSDYGNNRLYLERWMRENISDYHIVRIPALYGKNLKKNFVFDLINIIPTILSAERYQIIKKDLDIEHDYKIGEDGFYHFSCSDRKHILELRKSFFYYDFNAISFTDSRNKYQFYNLSWLWKHITIAIENDIKIVNLVTEPIGADMLFKSVYDKNFVNVMDHVPVKYNMKTMFDKIYQGSNGYILAKQEILLDIIEFIKIQIANLIGN